MAKWISSSTLELVATGAVLVAAVTVILRGGNTVDKGEGWRVIDPIHIATGDSRGHGVF